MLCKHFLAYTVHIDRCYYIIHKHSCRSQHTSVLTTCTFMFRQICTIEPSFFKTISGMHRCPIEGPHQIGYFSPKKSLKSLHIFITKMCFNSPLSFADRHPVVLFRCVLNVFQNVFWDVFLDVYMCLIRHSLLQTVTQLLRGCVRNTRFAWLVYLCLPD